MGLKELKRQLAEDRDRRRQERSQQLRDAYDRWLTDMEQRYPRLAQVRQEERTLLAQLYRSVLSPRAAAERQALQNRVKAIQDEKRVIWKQAGQVKPPPLYQCEKCEDKGWVVEYEDTPNGPQLARQYKCSCLKQEEMDDLFAFSRLPPKYKNASFAALDYSVYDAFASWPEIVVGNDRFTSREYAETIRDDCIGYAKALADGEYLNIVLAGAPGLGKTTIAACFANEVLRAGRVVAYVQALDLWRHRQRRETSDGVGNSLETDPLVSSELLILDDFASGETMTEFRIQEAGYIVNMRMAAQLPTVICTNRSDQELQYIFDDRFMSRIRGEYIWIDFQGPDIRYEIAQRARRLRARS